MKRQEPLRPTLRPFRPATYGRFQLVAPLATGGMGEVFLAKARFQGGLERLCVIKRILPELARDPAFLDRFLDEASTLVQLQHGSIAQVYDTGESEGAHWIALEFVDGKDLCRLLQRLRALRQRLPVELAIFIAIKVLEGLAYAHRRRDEAGRELALVHRDVSPQNILLSYEGEVKMIDFGLARSKLSLAEKHPEWVVGKLSYMAPEQARGEEVDRRADLYSVGVVLWEMLTGRNPFEGERGSQLHRSVVEPRIPPIRTVEPTLPAAVAAVVDRALAPEPSRRFPTAERMRARLATCLSSLAPEVGPDRLGSALRSLFHEEYREERSRLSLYLGDGAGLLPQRDARESQDATGDDAGEETQVFLAPPYLGAPRPDRRSLRLFVGLFALSCVGSGALSVLGAPVAAAEVAAPVALEAAPVPPADGSHLAKREEPTVDAGAAEVDEPQAAPAGNREALATSTRDRASIENRSRRPSRKVLLERRHGELKRRFDALVEAHGEDRVGRIVLEMKRAADTNFDRFIDDPERYDELETQLRSLQSILVERESAFR